MKEQMVFKRYELKYLITKEQQAQIMEAMKPYMRGDEYGRSSICSIYYDTPDFLLARRSLEKPVYKEKLRVRSYGIATPDSQVFIEMKRKYDSEVYKRRVGMTETQARMYLAGEGTPKTSQIIREIDYFRSLYPGLAPKVMICSEREAWYDANDEDFRLTFDEQIRWRDTELSLCKGIYGEEILPPGMTLMEIKTGTAIPLWMTRVLTENKITKTSFSKYGHAYQAIYDRKHLGGKKYA
jgi:hypothetical protein